MGHGKWTATDNHGYSEIPRKPECVRQWWDDTVWSKQPGFGLIGIRNQPTHLLLHLSVSVHVHGWICIHMHTCTLTCSTPKHTTVGSSQRNWSLFSYDSGEVLLTVPEAGFPTPSSLSRCPDCSLEAGTKQHSSTSVSPVRWYPQPRSPFSQNISFAFHAVQARCSGAAEPTIYLYMISYNGSVFYRGFPGHNSKE